MGNTVGTAYRPHFGGHWDNSAKCGSRGANWNNSALNLNSNIGARGVTETEALAGLTLRLAVLTGPDGQIHDGGASRLVGQPEAGRRIFS